jgi:hypothetical protein
LEGSKRDMQEMAVLGGPLKRSGVQRCFEYRIVINIIIFKIFFLTNNLNYEKKPLRSLSQVQ